MFCIKIKHRLLDTDFLLIVKPVINPLTLSPRFGSLIASDTNASRCPEMPIVTYALQTHSGAHLNDKTILITLSATYFSSRCGHGGCFARAFPPLQQNLGARQENFWWNASVFESFVLTVFMHPLFSVNVQFLRLTGMNVHSKWISKMRVHVTVETASGAQAEDAAGMTVCVIQCGHGGSAGWITWTGTEQLQGLWLAETSLPLI